MSIVAERSNGTTPSTDSWTNAICNDATPLNTWVRFVLFTDVLNEVFEGNYQPLLGGDSPGEYRFSTDGTNAGAGLWGGPVSLGNITNTDKNCWIQKRSWRRAQLILPQGNLVISASDIVDIGFVTSSGKADDIISSEYSNIGVIVDTGIGNDIIPAEGLFDLVVVDTGIGGDTIPCVQSTVVELAAQILDSGIGTDAFGTLVTVIEIPYSVHDTGLGTDAVGTLGTISPLADITDLTATHASTSVIDLSWGAITNRSHYQVDRATDANFTQNVTTNINSSGTSTTYQDTGLSTNTRYYYRVRAHGDGTNYLDALSYDYADDTTDASSAVTYYGHSDGVLNTTAPTTLDYTAGFSSANRLMWAWLVDGSVEHWHNTGEIVGSPPGHAHITGETVPANCNGVAWGLGIASGSVVPTPATIVHTELASGYLTQGASATLVVAGENWIEGEDEDAYAGPSFIASSISADSACYVTVG